MASSIMEDIVGVGGQVWDSGTTVLLEETVIRDISPWKNDAGTGLQVADGARLEVRKSLVDQASQTGILALGVGTEVMVEDTVVQETLPAGPNKLGLGIQVQPGATAEVLRCEFKECSVSSVSVLGQGATASLSDCIIRDTAAKEPDAGTGRGIELQQEASLVADAVLVESNRFEGIGVADGSTADLSAMVVRSTIGGGPQQVGRGLSVFGGGQATVTESVIAGNRDSGVFVMGAGSAVSLGGVLVADTLPNEVNGGGAGLIMSEGATLDVSDSWIRGNSGGGVSTQDSKTVLLMERTVVEDSLATWESELGPEVFGRGIDASYGAWASVSGCLVQGNTEVGVYASGSGGTMDLAGSIVRDTLCHEAGLAGGGHGMGVVAMGGANTQVRYALIQHNDTAGAACHGQVTELGLGHVAILDTQGGMSWYDDVAGTEQKQAFGDGAYAAEGCRMVVAASLLASNRRTGLYFLQSPGQVVGNLIHSNDFYGLAMEECADQVEWEEKGNYIVGNASALPPDKAAQVTTSTGGMAVPPAPEMIEIPSGTGE
ncbi:MAG: right-handed parallel beta-helix repeat-containing protein [Deltaproteobacteria bacterium]|nr:right-handed parallel beta-helix repeat-containing protein [Deltaproteobacteria bacterium]